MELPLFNGGGPIGWIARVGVYFHAMQTSPKVGVNLANLCMEGPMIHFYNSLLTHDFELTWERLTRDL